MSPPKLQPALLGGLLAGVLSALPFVGMANNCCCLWMIAGGAMAAWIMQQNHPLPVTLGNGATVGFLAGLFAPIVMVVVLMAIRATLGPMVPGLSMGGGDPFRSRRDMPPEVREVLRSVGPQVVGILAGTLFIVIELVFSTLGGFFGALIFRKAAPPAEPPPVPSHPPVIPPAGPPVESWTYPDQDKNS
jgi:hypothetical protein